MTARPVRRQAPRSRLQVIRGRRVGRVKPWSWLIFTLVALSLFFGLIISRTAMDNAAFELDSIRTQIGAEQARHDRLRLEVARLQSPERIAPLAQEMGLVFPDEVRLVTADITVAANETEADWAEMKSILSASP